MRAGLVIAGSVLAAQRATLAAAATIAALLGAIWLGWPEKRTDLFVLGVPLFAATLLGGFFVGVSLIGEELASGRLAFWFTRPISAWSIWGGKLGGALLVAAALSLAVLWPTASLGPDLPPRELAYVALSILLAVSAGMLSGIMTRGRSRLAYLNWPALLLVILIFLHGGQPLIVKLLVPLAVCLAIACLVGSAAGVVAGRTSPARAHAAASLGLWSVTAPGFVLSLIFYS